MITYSVLSIQAIVVLLVITCLLVIKSYDSEELIWAIPLTIISAFYPIVFGKMGWLNLEVFETQKYLAKFTLSAIALRFIVHYVMNFFSLKLANKFTSGNSSKFAYLIAFIIASSCLQSALDYLLSII